MSRSGRHRLAARAWAKRFGHRKDVDQHRNEHQHDGDPKPPLMMDGPLPRRLVSVMLMVGMLMLVRHALLRNVVRRLSKNGPQHSVTLWYPQIAVGQALQPDGLR